MAYSLVYALSVPTIFYDLSDFNNPPQVLPTLGNLARHSMCFMLFLCVPLESCAFLFHNVYHIVLCLPAFTLDCEFLRAQIPHLYGLTPTI